MASWSIRPYRPGDEVAILDLFNRVFEEDNVLFEPRTMEHWRWQFAENPMGHHTFVAEDPEGAMIGLYAAICGDWLHGADRFPGSQAVDTCVDKAYRRSLKKEGLFLQMAGAFFDRYGNPHNDRIIYGFPNPQAYRIGTRKLDYRPVTTPIERILHDADEAWAAGLDDAGAGGLATCEVPRFHPDTEDLFAVMARPLGLVQRRDLAHLRWRYESCPTIDYTILETCDPRGTLRGVAVVRREWFDKPIVPIVDWIVPGDDKAAIAALVQAATRMALAAGQERVETWVPLWSDHARVLQGLGMGREDSIFNQCIRIFGPDFDEHWAAENWWFTMGDSDIF